MNNINNEVLNKDNSTNTKVITSKMKKINHVLKPFRNKSSMN